MSQRSSQAILEPASIQLRFVSLDHLVLHEEDDPYRVTRMQRSLIRDGKLRNPPVVAEHENLYIVLDGATRTTALIEMDYRDILVQVVDYFAETIELHAWHHVIVGLSGNRLLSGLAEIEGLSLSTFPPGEAARLLFAREILACICLKSGQEYGVIYPGDVNQQATMLCRMVSLYRGKTEVHRTIGGELPSLIQQYPDLEAVVLFPTFCPQEVIQIAINHHKLPMGITRHTIAGRALGMNIALEMLTAARSLEAKNTWLESQVRQRLRANKIRLYQEPVFVFDE